LTDYYFGQLYQDMARYIVAKIIIDAYKSVIYVAWRRTNPAKQSLVEAHKSPGTSVRDLVIFNNFDTRDHRRTKTPGRLQQSLTTCR